MIDNLATAKQDYWRGEGGLLWSEAGTTVADIITEMSLGRVELLEAHDRFEYSGLNSTQFNMTYPLYYLSNSACNGLVGSISAKIDMLKNNGMVIQHRDIVIAEKHSVYDGGFADPDFPIHFSTAMVMQILHSAVKESIIPAEDTGKIGLLDCADVLQSDWFNVLMHQCSATRNGFWQTFGQNIDDLELSTLDKPIAGAGFTLQFIKFDKKQTDSGSRYIAKRSDALVRTLQRGWQESTLGCPVAHLSFELNSAPAMMRAVALEKAHRGTVVLKPNSDTAEQIFVPETPVIKQMLDAWAMRLRDYVDEFGEPNLVRDQDNFPKTITHNAPRAGGSVLNRCFVL